MRKIKLPLIAISSILTLIISGCGFNAIPELSQEDEAKVVTYMADLLLSHDASYSSNLLDEDEKEAARALELKKQEELEKQLAYEKEKQEKEQAERENRDIEKHEAESVEISYFAGDITKCANLPEGLSLEYGNYNIDYTYPGDESAAIYFSPLTATKEGNKLLVIHMWIHNDTDSILEYNSMDIGAKFRIIANGEKYPCMTHLYNDLNLFADDIEPNSATEAVLISEIPGDMDVSSLGLYIINSSNETFNIGL